MFAYNRMKVDLKDFIKQNTPIGYEFICKGDKTICDLTVNKVNMVKIANIKTIPSIHGWTSKEILFIIMFCKGRRLQINTLDNKINYIRDIQEYLSFAKILKTKLQIYDATIQLIKK